MDEIGTAGIRSWHALDILRIIERENPELYPVPTRDGQRDERGVIQIVGKRGDFLARERFVTLCNVCGEILHTRNPFASRPAMRLQTKEDCERQLKAAGR